MCYCLPNLVCRWMVACVKVWIELHITQQHYILPQAYSLSSNYIF